MGGEDEDIQEMSNSDPHSEQGIAPTSPYPLNRLLSPPTIALGLLSILIQTDCNPFQISHILQEGREAIFCS